MASRRERVSACFAPVIHSTYSRLWLGGKASKVARAFAFFRSRMGRAKGAAFRM